MNRFASTRSEKRASQPLPGRAQCSVGSIEDDGIRYGFTTYALIASTIAIAPTIVTIQSMGSATAAATRVSRSIGLRRADCGSAPAARAVSGSVGGPRLRAPTSVHRRSHRYGVDGGGS